MAPHGSGSQQQRKASRLPPSASGHMISDFPLITSTPRPSSTNNSNTPSRTSSPGLSLSTNHAPEKKVTVPSSPSMRGPATNLQDLESAIRSLELMTHLTNSYKTSDPNSSRSCNCQAQRHPLLTAAPNCLACGKIICAREGLGSCTFCGSAILSRDDIQVMLRALKEERGREKMSAHNAAHARPDVSKQPGAFSPAPMNAQRNSNAADDAGTSDRLDVAKAHRDRLLSYQSQNARRTQIHDEASDFDAAAPVSGWLSPQERALQLKRQQVILREQEWNQRPEHEKRRVIVSLDVSKTGKEKGVRRMEKIEGPTRHEAAEENPDDTSYPETASRDANGRVAGTFARNPLLGELIRPVYTPSEMVYNQDEKGKGRPSGNNDHADQTRSSRAWRTAFRRVQDDNGDNEEWILDGGAYGTNAAMDDRAQGTEERAIG